MVYFKIILFNLYFLFLYIKFQYKRGNHKVNYIDITEQVLAQAEKTYKIIEQQYYIDENKIRYDVDNKYVVFEPTKKEKEIAIFLGKIYGGNIYLIPKVNAPPNIKTPDYIVNDKKFDLKVIFGNGKHTLDNAIKKQKNQANNFIFDITQSSMSNNKIFRQIEEIFNSPYRIWIEQIILCKNNNIFKVYKRNN